MKKTIRVIFFGLIMISCSVEPKPINYGFDACHSCKMNIIQQKFGGEIVTKKGKVYKYDAIECLVDDVIDNWDENKLKFILAVDYNNPTDLIDATKAYHLKSKNIPSPMGAYLSTYSSKALAEESKRNNGGEIMDWKSLIKRYFESNLDE